MGYADFDLAGRVAIVTGAGRGLGRGMAFALAEAGARVVVADRSKDGAEETVELISRRGTPAHPVVFDAAIGEDCRRLATETVALHGRIDALIVSHGINQFG